MWCGERIVAWSHGRLGRRQHHASWSTHILNPDAQKADVIRVALKLKQRGCAGLEDFLQLRLASCQVLLRPLDKPAQRTGFELKCAMFRVLTRAPDPIFQRVIPSVVLNGLAQLPVHASRLHAFNT